VIFACLYAQLSFPRLYFSLVRTRNSFVNSNLRPIIFSLIKLDYITNFSWLRMPHPASVLKGNFFFNYLSIAHYCSFCRLRTRSNSEY